MPGMLNGRFVGIGITGPTPEPLAKGLGKLLGNAVGKPGIPPGPGCATDALGAAEPLGPGGGCGRTGGRTVGPWTRGATLSPGPVGAALGAVSFEPLGTAVSMVIVGTVG